ncbi:membrane dipeptidase [Pseudoponticoccus marisrubri]|uniref:Peptidase M19 n=1 Tax=Pseudoponticoccus marisrubri TaxID=1685382 RepID=A0A0W7WNW5_9RHOB|nr:membrane dipeptidase [Pseudoponticoccus marisrubri]KUF12196.1 peptidase M19 [Pseudoponticoccus marisrubri]
MQAPVIDNLQYCNFSERIFRHLREGGVDAIHVTVAYHEDFRETVANLARWNRLFERHPGLILRGTEAAHVAQAQASGRTAVFFGLQTPHPLGDDIGMVEILHQLGIRFMQLSYNTQSLLAAGYLEDEDTGLTRMGREVVAEMNRVGLVVDMSHSGERSTLEAIEAATRPIAITHANPDWWHPVARNKSDTVLKELTNAGGMLGLSLYPHHLKDGPDCTLAAFCEMVAEAAERYGADNLGIGSDLCQDQPDSVVRWMRAGRWTRAQDDSARFPPQPEWFRDNRDWDTLRDGLRGVGFSRGEADGILGANWLRFYETSFGPA